MQRRFLQHSRLTEDIKKIEYIECDTEADMIWKEIYYINLYYNSNNTNIQDVYSGGVTDIGIHDVWEKYSFNKGNSLKNKNYHISFDEINYMFKGYDLKGLIKITDNYKLNKIGENKYDLSKQWFYQATSQEITTVKRAITNFFRNKANCNSSDILWTTYDNMKLMLKSKGYTKGFVSLDDEVDSNFSNRTHLAFIANTFLPVSRHNVSIDEDGFALSEMLQFIWRSAIRDKKEICLYIPSVRMRNLLKKWINDNSPKNHIQTEK